VHGDNFWHLVWATRGTAASAPVDRTAQFDGTVRAKANLTMTIAIKRWTDGAIIATGEPGDTFADVVRACVRDGVSLSYASLCGADLRGCDLRGVDFTEADLEGADMRGVNIDGATLTGAFMFNTRGMPNSVLVAD
jgi:uncharacterized protein YjbI with pentapeptide repeats